MINEYGQACEKCKEWVNPYAGHIIFGLCFCKKDFTRTLDKLQNFIRGLNETT